MSKTYAVGHYQHVHDAEVGHFWFFARNGLVAQLVRRYLPVPKGVTFLDIGCGTGQVLMRLEKDGYDVTGLDVNARALDYTSSKTKAQLVRSSLFTYRPKYSFAAAGAFDVLEHVGNDHLFLTAVHRLLEPGGKLFLTVPAFPWLWSTVDDLSGHKRRYTATDLSIRLERAGFRVLQKGYWNALLLPVYILQRSLIRNKEGIIKAYLHTPHPVLNRVLRWVFAIEMMIAPGRWPFGATLVVVAQKTS